MKIADREENNDEEGGWITFEKSDFHLSKDMYVCATAAAVQDGG